MFNTILRPHKVDIFVRFTNDSDQSSVPGVPRFVPGETVTGVVTVTPSVTLRCERLLIQLKWRTEGRGDTDEGIIDRSAAYQGLLTAGTVTTAPFSFVLPHEPWSYVGRYISIVWGIDVEIATMDAKGLNHFAPLILAPTWIGMDR